MKRHGAILVLIAGLLSACGQSATWDDIANPPPTAAFGLNAAARSERPVRFSSTSKANAVRSTASIVQCVWDFGDGSEPVTGAEVQHTFPTPGTYPVRLTVTDDVGLTASTTREIEVAEPNVIGPGRKTFSVSGHAVVARADGTVWTWGIGDDGRLGNNSTADRNAAGRVAGLSDVVAVSAGGGHTLAVRSDGTVWGWGDTTYRQLGWQSDAPQFTPAQVAGVDGAVAVAAGWASSLALRSDGTVWAWGWTYADDWRGYTLSAPAPVPGLSNIVSIVAAHTSSYALDADGTVWAWGYNTYGQLGDGSYTNRVSPVRVTGIDGVAALDAGGEYAVAVRRDGTVWTWGKNDDHQLGDGTEEYARPVPGQVPGLADVVAVAAGSLQCVAIEFDGRAWTWGRHPDSSVDRQPTPTPLEGLGGAVAAAGGIDSALVVDRNGDLWSWGWDQYGLVGDGGRGGSTRTPVRPVRLGDPLTVRTAAVSYDFGVAVDTDGAVWSWGRGNQGELGGGAEDEYRPEPMPVPGMEGVAAVAAGSDFSLALKSDGTVWGWGSDSFRQLGQGASEWSRPSPVQVLNVTGATAIAAGSRHGLALTSDGTVWAWGYDAFGDGVSQGNGAPVQLRQFSDAVAVAAGSGHSLAATADGTLWAWGGNEYGQLGDGTVEDRDAPVRVAGIDGVVAAAAGFFHSVALRADGTVWAWGNNESSQLGDGSTTDQPSPVQVQGLSGVVAIAAGGRHSAALKSDGTLWAWGDNTTGPKEGSHATAPVQVEDLADVAGVATGWGNSIAILADRTLRAWGNASSPPWEIPSPLLGFLSLAADPP